MMAKTKDKTDSDTRDARDAHDSSDAGRLQQAVRVALAREVRTESPDGEWEDGLWLPSPQERRPCCEGVVPSPANRQALESHCRTQRHVAQLFDVPLAELKSAIRRSRSEEGRRPGAPREGAALTELVRVSGEARTQALSELREAIVALEANVPRLLEEITKAVQTGSAAGDLRKVLDGLLEDIGRLQALVEFNRSVEDAYQSAQSVQEALETLRGLKKESAA
jgi:hypothetical protein